MDGAPVLRDGAERRVLERGDIVCFPPGMARTRLRARADSSSSLESDRLVRSCRSTRTPTRSRCALASSPEA
ncbi:MAG: hypothetical protein JOZ07_05155 [Solirubrobacterales bacterium]|nr:hypothetical protein [Solirubrobacterales bacterium]